MVKEVNKYSEPQHSLWLYTIKEIIMFKRLKLIYKVAKRYKLSYTEASQLSNFELDLLLTK